MVDAAQARSAAVAAGLELIELVRLVPRMLGRALLGALAGGAIGSCVGIVVVLVMRLLGWGHGSGWLAWGLAAVSVLAFGVGGTWIGGLRGCALALARSIDERRWVERLWVQVRPQVALYAQRVREGAGRAEARRDARKSLERDDDAAAGDGIAMRTERYVAKLVHGGLTRGLLGAMMRAVDRDGDAGWQDIERDGLRLATEAVGDMVARMFHGPAIIALLITIAAAAAPHALAAMVG